MTFLLRKVALAPDRNDHDDAQAAIVDEGGGSPPDPAPDASPGDSDDVRDPVAQGGDTDTEGTIAEVWDPAPDAPATDAVEAPDLTTPDAAFDNIVVPDPPVPDAVDPEVVSPDPAAEQVGAPDIAGKDDATHDVVDPDSVGFDGRSPVEPSDEAEPDDIDADAPPAAPTPRSRKKAVAALTVLSLVVVGAGVGELVWSRRSTKAAAPPPTTLASSPSPTLSDGAFVTFKDSEAGFSIRYPRGWTRSQPPVAEIRLWATDGKQFAASVRVTRTQEVTTAANLANLKAVTDGIVGPGVQILKQDPITVNDLVGYRYIYTFTEPASGLTTAHLHYFLFQGHKMNSIVFEAVPGESFSKIEGVFDQMLGSFHSDPEPP